MLIAHLAAVDPRVFKELTTHLLRKDDAALDHAHDLVAAWPRSVHALAVAGALVPAQTIQDAHASISAAN
jgi:hypothetical protein